MKTISDHMLDLIQNSIHARATMIKICVVEDDNQDTYILEVIDDGKGMDELMVSHAADPFFTTRTTRKVGLGLALLKQNALAANGVLLIKSIPGIGTKIRAAFQLSHIDRPPAGEPWDVYYLMLVANPTVRLIYDHKSRKGNFIIDSSEVKSLLNETPLKHPEIRKAIIELIRSNLYEIRMV